MQDSAELQMLPASCFAHFDAILRSREFPKHRDAKQLFLTFTDGAVVGGLLPKPTQDTWGAQEYVNPSPLCENRIKPILTVSARVWAGITPATAFTRALRNGCT